MGAFRAVSGWYPPSEDPARNGQHCDTSWYEDVVSSKDPVWRQNGNVEDRVEKFDNLCFVTAP